MRATPATLKYVHAIEAAHHQALQVQLGGDAQRERHVQAVVVPVEYVCMYMFVY